MPNPFANVNLRNLLNLRLGGTQRLARQAKSEKARSILSKMVRKIGYDVGQRLVRSLNGIYDAPKRIDTGRYRAGWAIGTSEATGIRLAAGVTHGADGRFQSSSHADTSQPGDGVGSLTQRPYYYIVTVTNNVEYGPYLEFGTPRMAAGYHRDKALRFVQDRTEKALGIAIRMAWGL